LYQCDEGPYRGTKDDGWPIHTKFASQSDAIKLGQAGPEPVCLIRVLAPIGRIGTQE
jgi:hypothetical protein